MADHIAIKIYGQVQGVFFRVSLRDKGESLGLAGFVRNEPDGSVYAEAEGEDGDLEKLLAWCRQGPPGSKVEKVESKMSDKIKKFTAFEIKY